MGPGRDSLTHVRPEQCGRPQRVGGIAAQCKGVQCLSPLDVKSLGGDPLWLRRTRARTAPGPPTKRAIRLTSGAEMSGSGRRP